MFVTALGELLKSTMEVERNTHPLLPGMDHYKPKAGSVSNVPQRDMLQQAMKQGSKDLHDQAENAAFIHKVIYSSVSPLNSSNNC